MVKNVPLSNLLPETDSPALAAEKQVWRSKSESRSKENIAVLKPFCSFLWLYCLLSHKIYTKPFVFFDKDYWNLLVQCLQYNTQSTNNTSVHMVLMCPSIHILAYRISLKENQCFWYPLCPASLRTKHQPHAWSIPLTLSDHWKEKPGWGGDRDPSTLTFPYFSLYLP